MTVSKLGLEMTHKLNERGRNGYPKQLSLGYVDAINDLEKIMYWQPTKLDEPQLYHLNFLKKRFEHHRKDQEYPFTFALEDWLKGEEGADLEDKEYMIVINAFTVWALEKLELQEIESKKEPYYRL